MTPNATASPPVIPADVAAFAAQRGVADYVGPLLDLTRRLFPGAAAAIIATYCPSISKTK